MNAPTNLSRDLRERLLASYILGGGVKDIPDAEDFYTTAEWREAAQRASDEDDYRDLRFMTRQAELWTDYRNSGSDLDFSDWLTRGNFDAGARHPDDGRGI